MSKLAKHYPALGKTPYYQKVLRTQRDYLLAYWMQAEPSGSVALDTSGNSRTGAYTGVDLGQAGIGDGKTCPWFDGVNDYNNVYSTSLRDAFNGAEGSVACWAKVNSAAVWTDGVERFIVRFRTDGASNVLIEKNAINNQIQWEYRAADTVQSRVSTVYNLNTWLHLALTWSKSGDVVRAYGNGEQVGADMTGLGIWAGELLGWASLIGAFVTTPGAVWHGWLAHVPVWSIALTGAEVANLAKV